MRPDVTAAVDLSNVPPRLRSKLAAPVKAVRGMTGRAMVERVAERIQNSRDKEQLALARGGGDTCWVDESEDEPLVSIRMVTFNRVNLLMDRALPSILGQSYPRIEVVIVGDHADEATGRALAGLADPRVRYVNLARRPLYPANGWSRWSQLGVAAHNVSLQLSAGAWFTVCDDDDEIFPDHVESLLATARQRRVELVHGRTLVELGEGRTGVLGRSTPTAGHTTHGAVMFSAGLRFFRYRESCGQLGEAQDWNLWRRMLSCGVTAAPSDAIGYHYFPLGPTLTAFRSVADRAGF